MAPPYFQKLPRRRNNSSSLSLEPNTIRYTAATMPSTYKKDKPWDTDDIDKWKVSISYSPSN